MAESKPALERILRVLEDGGYRPSRGEKEQWQALCPAHEDTSPSLSIGIGKDNRVLLKCHAGCALEAILSKLGLRSRDLFVKQPRGTLTLEELAKAKGFSVEELAAYGVRDFRDVVRFDYGEGCRYRLRASLRAKEGSYWGGEKSLPIVPYGLWRLSHESDTLILVEGESDCWSLWHHDYPAIGLPGAQMAHCLEAEHLHGVKRLFIMEEPDQGGEAFVRGLVKRLNRLRFKGTRLLLRFPEGIKDANALHLQVGGDRDAFTDLFDKALADALPPPAFPLDPRLERLIYWGGLASLTPQQFKLYCGLMALETRIAKDRNGYFLSSYSLLEKETGLSASSIRHSLDGLSDRGLVEIVRGSRKLEDHAPNRYRLPT